ESLQAAALREVEEETGLTPAELELHPLIPSDPAVPFDIDTHYIPENPRKDEPGHYHHDFRYVYTVKLSEVSAKAVKEEVCRWVSWQEFSGLPHFSAIADKIEALLEPNTRDFFRSLVGVQACNVAVVAVSHIIPSSESYILSLHENFTLVGVIPKPTSLNKRSRRVLIEAGVPILDSFSRASLAADPEALVRLLAGYEKVCLVDIGGYFSPILAELKSKLGRRLCGVVEDTENGHQKYAQHDTGRAQVVSVARSPLKDFEDQLVGHSVAHATETVLRQINVLITYRTCGIIGYGKVGRGIAEYLRQRGIRPLVSELNAVRLVQASCDGAAICSTDELLKKSDILFCATGTKALDLLKLRDLKRGAFLASVTSSDDEFDLTFVDSEYERQPLARHITRFSKRGHSFHLLNDGNAINFLYAAAVDAYINLVQGELIYSVSKLATAGYKDSREIHANATDDHEMIARRWLEYVMRARS
ncbi:MAG TPA: NUDIX domain-containing protein, partial [Ktedonobacteraceae bacterium]|nr:NUDIX domain-containing protein [Ktedonobacteraceae bacterium]